MNKFLQYINETLESLDIPVLINIDEKPTSKRLKKNSNKSSITQKE